MPKRVSSSAPSQQQLKRPRPSPPRASFLALPNEIRQKILLLCYDTRIERMVQRTCADPRTMSFDTCNRLRRFMDLNERSFHMWLYLCLQRVFPEMRHDVVHVKELLKGRLGQTRDMVQQRRNEAMRDEILGVMRLRERRGTWPG
jgi:hypothetical protein